MTTSLSEATERREAGQEATEGSAPISTAETNRGVVYLLYSVTLLDLFKNMYH